MKRFLEVEFSGWTATPRMPFVLSGNALCMPVPSYSLVLGIVGCCVGKPIYPKDIGIGFQYTYESVAIDKETRQRLVYDGKKVKKHSKGSDAYDREFHTNPKLVVWLDAVELKPYFESPIGTPVLGRSQDLLKITRVREVEAVEVANATLSGVLLPFDASMNVAGQLVQLAEYFVEDDDVGNGRSAINPMTFIALPSDSKNKVSMERLYAVSGEGDNAFYFHSF